MDTSTPEHLTNPRTGIKNFLCSGRKVTACPSGCGIQVIGNSGAAYEPGTGQVKNCTVGILLTCPIVSVAGYCTLSRSDKQL